MTSAYTALVTGGAGFIGARLALGLRAHRESIRVIALDNLKRRGSELNLRRLAEGGVEFIHGDVRTPEDLPRLDRLDLLIECSAEPSVLAGFGDSPRYVIDSNLFGAVHCLELARRHEAALIFLSTSRVYPVEALRAIPLVETDSRFILADGQSSPGVSREGVNESFPLDGHRSLYGATKYAAELLIAEYEAMYGLRAVVNRCGVVAGPGQMGRVDQGVLALWVARHIFGGSLSYIGYGGRGKQVRDMLHVDDLLDLILRQIDALDAMQGKVFNVGGGLAGSVSLLELTGLCRECAGTAVDVSSAKEDRPADIPWYITDSGRVAAACGWRPARDIKTIVQETARWMLDNQEQLRPIFAP